MRYPPEKQHPVDTVSGSSYPGNVNYGIAGDIMSLVTPLEPNTMEATGETEMVWISPEATAKAREDTKVYWKIVHLTHGDL